MEYNLLYLGNCDKVETNEDRTYIVRQGVIYRMLLSLVLLSLK